MKAAKISPQPAVRGKVDPALEELYCEASESLDRGDTPHFVLTKFFHGVACILSERLITERELAALLRRSIDFARDKRVRRQVALDWPPEIRFGSRGQPLYLWSDVVTWIRRIRNLGGRR